ncbi:MAG TPA: HEAT repeat domain-containing protein [Planctomycetota bacterium]
MGFLAATLTLFLLSGQEAEGRAASQRTPEELAAYKKKLEEALAPGFDAEDARRVILRSRDHVDPSVIALLDAKALRGADPLKRDQAVDALGYMRHPDALETLHGMLKRDGKTLQESPPSYANLIRAVARHGKTSSIPLLVEDLFQSPDRSVIEARIMGLANIRASESVGELIQMMRSGPPPRVSELGLELRTALVYLTGVDKGTDQTLWINWYGGARDTLVIAPEPPEELPPELRRCWTSFWGPERQKARGPARPVGDRKRPDPEKPKQKRVKGEKEQKDE